MLKKIPIADIIRDGLQTRVAINQSVIDDYSDAITNGAKFPPVIVFQCDNNYFLADGFHRVAAREKIGMKYVKADVFPGGLIDALKYAASANANHGLQRTQADKRNALEMVWRDRMSIFDGCEPSAQMLADMCAVSRRFVQLWKKENGFSTSERSPVERTETTAETGDGTTDKETETASQSENKTPPATSERSPVEPPRRVIGKDGKTRIISTRNRAETASQSEQHTETDERAGHVPTVMLDRFNHEIPENLEHAFESREIHEILIVLSGIRTRIRAALDRKDTAFAHMSQRVLISLDAAYSDIKAAKPYCVCRICQGVDGCRACSETGFQNEDQYARNPPELKHNPGE